jgi:energy-coupling factor transport system ATP-binding protein
VIHLKGVGLDAPGTHGRASRRLLDEIDLHIHQGEYLALVGPNGAGKSLLIQVMAGLREPSRGEITFDHADLSRARSKTSGERLGAEETTKRSGAESMAAVRDGVGIVFQNPDDQIVGATVERDLAFGLENLAVPSAEIRRRVDEALASGSLRRLARMPPHLLSEGEKQRVALASVLLLEPGLLLLDEPTSRLDVTGRLEFLAAMGRARERPGTTVVHVTHSSRDALSCDRIVGLRAGRVVFDGSPGEFVRSAESDRLGMIWSALHRFLRELLRLGVEFKEGRGAEWNDVDWVFANLPAGLGSSAASVRP